MSFHALRRAPSIRTGARLIGVTLEPLPDDVRGHQDRLQGLHHRRGKALLLRLNRSPPAAKVCHDPWLSTLNIALFAAANVAAPSSGSRGSAVSAGSPVMLGSLPRVGNGYRARGAQRHIA